MDKKSKLNLKNLFANPSLFTLFFLGISCGFPYALTASVLKTWLADYNISMKEVGAFAFVAIPYSIKFLWSPFIDGVKIPILGKLMGQRRSWLIVIQSLLVLSIFLLSQAKPEESLIYCAVIATLVAFLSASQDIVVDAYRIEKLPTNMQSMGVTMYIYGYRLGLYISGAVLLIIADKFFNWSYAYYTGGILMAGALLITIFSAEPTHKYHEEKSPKNYLEHLKRIVIHPFTNFIETKGWQYLIIFIIIFRLGDALAGNLTNPFLIKIGFTKTEVALIVKTYGLFATLFGAFLGGLIVHHFNNMSKALLFAVIIQMLSNVMFIVQDQVGHNNYVLAATISIDNALGSITDVIFIGYLSSLCNLRFAATQYALLSSIATVGRNFISGTSGFIVDDYGWSVFFTVSIVITLPALLMLAKIKDIKPKTIE
jgi:PAT family beta-lactamase induction signal transducer AmpG